MKMKFPLNLIILNSIFLFYFKCFKFIILIPNKKIFPLWIAANSNAKAYDRITKNLKIKIIIYYFIKYLLIIFLISNKNHLTWDSFSNTYYTIIFNNHMGLDLDGLDVDVDEEEKELYCQELSILSNASFLKRNYL